MVITLRLRFILKAIILCSWSLSLNAQSTLERGARAQLNDLGISELEIKERLAERGISVEGLSALEIAQLQPVVEQIVREIEIERKQPHTSLPSNTQSSPGNTQPASRSPQKSTGSGTPVVPTVKATPDQKLVIDTSFVREAQAEVRKLAAKSSKEVAKKVKEGATVEEAISESLIDQANVEDSKKSKIYGQELFKNKSIDVFRATKDAKPPDSYILGVGDEITVTIFGASQGDFRYEINEEGYISPKGMGKIFLKGVPYKKAKELVKARFDRNFLFRDDQFVMNLATARTVSVNIFGEVENPGTFAISSINTAFNALAAAGGPTDIGSVRRVMVTRNGVSKTLDVYAFMKDGSLQYDFYLENNDVIHVPVAERMITLQGGINKPYTFELLPHETLGDLIEYAGGLLPNAYRSSLQLKRVIGKRVVLQDIDLDKNPNFALQNGDVVTVKLITEAASNSVSVEGEVEFPGAFALEDHTDLASLIFRATPKRTARTDMAFLFRKETDGQLRIMQVNLDEVVRGEKQSLELQPADRLIIFKQERYIDAAEVGIIGAVREPKIQPYSSGTRLSEYIQLSGGLREDALPLGYIIRQPVNGRKKEYIRIYPIKAVKEPGGAADLTLFPSDSVRILSELDYRDSAYVRVSGAVNRPVSLPFGEALTLSDAIMLAGGLKRESKLGRIDIFRIELDKREKSRTLQTTLEVTNEDELPSGDMILEPFDEVVVRSVPEFSLHKKVKISGEVKYAGEYSIQKENERLSDLIQRAGGLTSAAYPVGSTMTRRDGDGSALVAARLESALKKPGSMYDLILQDGDEIVIPRGMDLVTIYVNNSQATEVFNAKFRGLGDKILATYQPTKRSKWYIKEYVGGVGEFSSLKHLKVQYANGKLKRSRNMFGMVITPRVAPGASILLATDPDKLKPKTPTEPKKPLDWDKAFTQTLSFLSAAATIVLAIAAINK